MSTDPSSARAFNLDEALQRVDGDRELLAEIAGIFLSDAPAMLADVAASVAASDATAVSRTAHRLKGSILTFGAPAASAAALRLEQSGRTGDLTTAQADVEQLAIEVERLRVGLEVVVQEQKEKSA